MSSFLIETIFPHRDNDEAEELRRGGHVVNTIVPRCAAVRTTICAAQILVSWEILFDQILIP